ncbi:MAG TPA: hypothetical protein PLL75_08010 [Candidatus Omnitrophota bacterium]|nr:hypothetical protein [Candidatus Omnitrophota bacterium]HPS37651.1 hypothetical protein [Candidatus Omnitrophota bacterium]
MRKRVLFAKAKSEKSETSVTALLWAISGGEAIHFDGVKKDGEFWTVEEAFSVLSSRLIKTT